MPRLFLVLAALMLTACATGYPGGDLRPGVTTESAIRQQMGVPAMVWALPDGGRQLAYPHGPAGFVTFMVYLDKADRLQRIENVLDAPHFARIQAEMTQEEVLQILGPPQPQWTAYFAARDELVWEWRYCDSWREAARFDVLFDGTTKRVRSTLSWTESQKSHWRVSC
ncbi:MAG: hypothetical protein L6Q60_07395 [Rhodocyclaceae bacterium]|nr:hypothetical protein [Rhodocyclaceae bacterium]